MQKTFLITKYIRKILSMNEDLMKMIPIERIFPVDAKQGTKFPFVVVARTGLIESSSKDGIYQDNIEVTVIVVDDNYVNSIEIANEIRKWLEGHIYKDEDINIRKIRLVSTSEAFYNNAYIQEMGFSILVN